MGDMVDLLGVTALDAPASRFTYMLAEYFPESDIQVTSVGTQTGLSRELYSRQQSLPDAQIEQLNHPAVG